jgi:hypothetical protein
MAFKGFTGVFQAFRYLIVLYLVISLINAANITEMENLHMSLFTGYNKNVRPIMDQSLTIDVKVFMFIKSIKEFDEVDEKFSFVAALQLHWMDEKLRWDKKLNGGIEQITVSYDDVWVPELTLSSPSSKGTTIGKSSDRIRVNDWGETEWMPAGLIESTCNVNAKKFPFDTQSCDIKFMSLGYKSNEVNLVAGVPYVMFNVYSPHALWDVTGSEVKTTLLGSDHEVEITFTLQLKRDATFAVINIIMPISVLSLLNVLVFILVPESGERIAYCITTLLSIAVYMTIVNDFLPQTSQPVPLISYKLMIDLLTSALIVFVTIVNMRLYSKDDNNSVPKLLKFVYRFLFCTGRKTYPEDTAGIKAESENNSNERSAMQENPSKHNGNKSSNGLEHSEKDDGLITWKRISYMIDWIALFTCLLFSVINMIIFIGMTTS